MAMILRLRGGDSEKDDEKTEKVPASMFFGKFDNEWAEEMDDEEEDDEEEDYPEDEQADEKEKDDGDQWVYTRFPFVYKN